MVKNPPTNAGDPSLIPGLGRSPGEGNGNPLQYSCLGNPTDRGTSRAAVHGVTKSQKQLHMKTIISFRTYSTGSSLVSTWMGELILPFSILIVYLPLLFFMVKGL